MAGGISPPAILFSGLFRDADLLTGLPGQMDGHIAADRLTLFLFLHERDASDHLPSPVLNGFSFRLVLWVPFSGVVPWKLPWV